LKNKKVESNDSPKKAHKHDSQEQIKWKITFFWDKNGNFSLKPNNLGFENSKLSWLNNTSPVAFLVLYDLSDIRTTAFWLASEHNITGIINITLRGKNCMLMREIKCFSLKTISTSTLHFFKNFSQTLLNKNQTMYRAH